MVSNLGSTQRKIGSTTLEVTLINFDYQILWLKIVVNGEMLSNHPDMLKSPTLIGGEKKAIKLDSKVVSALNTIKHKIRADIGNNTKIVKLPLCQVYQSGYCYHKQLLSKF